ncbi:MAG TPA: hypothetical protein PKN73_00300 [Candidatus Paceibacterota bacterium]|jgi:hypothetical protein|nr:hypothetical protein [Candidatus Paceibacterota bacterium]HOH11114.1 hypothetical protein [Candidatus Paceibacterota bacterium]HPB60674.1 hypothetical protein [Candidatus Paceibacterota bacterium]HPY12801.1 hypothetical protein [Candidatus Paceibacterota bacterium]HQB26758.1 hypothetical protein [Candidatus Paceibacterota bacterium]
MKKTIIILIGILIVGVAITLIIITSFEEVTDEPIVEPIDKETLEEKEELESVKSENQQINEKVSTQTRVNETDLEETESKAPSYSDNSYHPADINKDYKISREEIEIAEGLFQQGEITKTQLSQAVEFFNIPNGYRIQKELDNGNFPTNVNFRNCDYSGFFDEKGGIFRCQNGGGIEVKIDNSKAMGNFKIGLEITVPEEKEINERQDSSIPYLGAIKIDLKEIGQSPQDYSGPAPVFTVNVPLKSKLPPGTRLEARLKGDYIGLGIQEWRLQGEGLAAVVSDDGLTASFESKELPGLFIVSRFVLPIINYDEILNQN